MFNMSNKDNKQENINLLPDIEYYLQSRKYDRPISLVDIKEIVDEVVTKSILDKDKVEIIIQTLFEEIRNLMLAGEIISLKNLGAFFISSPKVTNNSKTIFPKLNIYKSFKKKLKQK